METSTLFTWVTIYNVRKLYHDSLKELTVASLFYSSIMCQWMSSSFISWVTVSLFQNQCLLDSAFSSLLFFLVQRVSRYVFLFDRCVYGVTEEYTNNVVSTWQHYSLPTPVAPFTNMV